MIKILRKECVILKADKGTGVVVMKIEDYNNCLNELFSDKSCFKMVDTDRTLTRLRTLQNYLLRLFKRKEISETEKKAMTPKAATFARAHCLPKTHKDYDTLPPYRPVVDTTGTPDYKVGKFLANLLNPLTTNEHTSRDSFDAANKI